MALAIYKTIETGSCLVRLSLARMIVSGQDGSWQPGWLSMARMVVSSQDACQLPGWLSTAMMVVNGHNGCQAGCQQP